MINSKFKQDIGYRNAVVYSKYNEDEQPIKIDIRVARYGSDSKGLGLRNVYYKPGTNIYIGDILTFDGGNWLIVDHYYDNFAPRSIVHFCNNKLDLLDDNGDEIFYPCVLENKITRYQEIDTYNRYIPLPDDVLMCIVSYNSNTSKIKHRDRFVFKDTNPKRTWEVQAYDNIAYVREGHGVVYLTLKRFRKTKMRYLKIKKKLIKMVV